MFTNCCAVVFGIMCVLTEIKQITIDKILINDFYKEDLFSSILLVYAFGMLVMYIKMCIKCIFVH